MRHFSPGPAPPRQPCWRSSAAPRRSRRRGTSAAPETGGGLSPDEFAAFVLVAPAAALLVAAASPASAEAGHEAAQVVDQPHEPGAAAEGAVELRHGAGAALVLVVDEGAQHARPQHREPLRA